MQAKITKRVVDAAVPADGATIWVWDTELRGFGLRGRSAASKVYVLEYRPHPGGRRTPKRRLTIGRHGSPWTPETARSEARRLLGVIANGGDPSTDKARLKAAPLVSEMVERYLAEHVRPKRKATTAKEYGRLLSVFIVPAIGSQRVTDTGRRDLLKIHTGMASTPYQANRVLAVSSAFFSFVELVGERPKDSNPTHGIEPYPEKERERMLSPRELGWLGDAMADAEAAAVERQAYEFAIQSARLRLTTGLASGDRRAGGAARRELAHLRASRPPVAIPAQALLCFRLLLFTGARLGEVLTMQWEWINFDRGDARLPDSKTGRKTIHLPAPALDVLSRASRFTDNPYVATGERRGGHFVGIQKPWRAIRNAATVKAWAATDGAPAELVARLARELGRTPTFEECTTKADKHDVTLAPELSNLRIHDLRHAFASVGVAASMGLPIIGKMLGHARPETTQRYAHLSSDPVKAAAASVANTIAAGLGGMSGADVVTLAHKAGR